MSNDDDRLVRATRHDGDDVPQLDGAEVGELLLGTKVGRTSPAQITLYKSVGIAAQDLAAAHLALTAARKQNLGLEVDLSA